MVKFSENFWPDHCNSTVGFEVLTRRLKDGKLVCKEIEDFVKQRAKIEEDYSKAMTKLVRDSVGKLEIGTLKMSLDKLKRETETVAAHHMAISQALADQAGRVHTLVDKQHATRKATEDSYKKVFSTKVDSYKKTMNAKKNYQAKHSAMILAMSQLTGVDPDKDRGLKEKLEVKKAKADEEEHKADQAYRATVESLDKARVDWENQMVQTCDVYEELETYRIQFLRNELWAYSNMGSQLAVDIDTAYEKVREALIGCDWNEDMCLFVRSKKTGQVRPPPIVYEPVNGGRHTSSSSGDDFYNAIPGRAASIRSDDYGFSGPTYESKPISSKNKLPITVDEEIDSAFR